MCLKLIESILYQRTRRNKVDRPGLTPADKVVLISLAMKMKEETDEVTISRTDISWDAGLQSPTVHTCLSRLLKTGYISKSRPPSKTAESTFKFNIHKFFPKEAKSIDEMSLKSLRKENQEMRSRLEELENLLNDKVWDGNGMKKELESFMKQRSNGVIDGRVRV